VAGRPLSSHASVQAPALRAGMSPAEDPIA
jgi:hypothetical protein